MIIVDEITIEEFRGIRKLTLKPKGKNFAVCGPNGTGKSGVVDALEFVLTGNISRLSGAGTGGVTLKKHAPHVDSRDFPEKAKVIVKIRVPSLKNKVVTIERNVKNAQSPTISPNSAETQAVLRRLESHPEIVLSRRELIAYVLAQPGKRSEEIQALLQLNKIGEFRGKLKTVCNSCTKDLQTQERQKTTATDNLVKALEITDLKAEKVLDAVNKRRLLLSLPPIDSFTAATVIDDGVKTASKTSGTQRINKAEATADIKSLQTQIADIYSPKSKAERKEVYDELEGIKGNQAFSSGLTKEQFLRTAINLISDDLCPVCDTKWDLDNLRQLITTKLKAFEEAARTRVSIEKKLQPVLTALESLTDNLSKAEKHAKILLPEESSAFSDFRSQVLANIKIIKALLPIDDSKAAIASLVATPVTIESAIKNLEQKIAGIPEPSEQDAARDYLVLSNDRMVAWRDAARAHKKAKEQSDLATLVYDTYSSESDLMLEEVYKDVENEFSDYYRSINSDDEGTFTAKLAPSMGKLGFDVEFYGRGHFPPGAYHSEGHQDGMGLCLYLALMKQLQGDNFRFAVLDDVLMSVDTGHRREVCNLLKKNFPHTQFVLTTHDEVWLKHMSTAGLVDPSNSVRFSNWTPDQGPTEWQNRDVWHEIESALKQNNVREAASLLRHYSEYIFKEICHNLKASVEFRGDGRYELGDLMIPGITRLRNLLKEGATVSESWGKNEDATALRDIEKKVTEFLKATNAEQWQVNPAIHYNEWANFDAADFTPVATTFKNLIEEFSCKHTDCKSLFHLTMTPPKNLDALRCHCGDTNINLKKKKATAAA